METSMRKVVMTREKTSGKNHFFFCCCCLLVSMNVRYCEVGACRGKCGGVAAQDRGPCEH